MLQGWGIEVRRGRAAGRWIVCLGVYNAGGLVTWINVYLLVGGGHRVISEIFGRWRMLVDSVCEIIWDQLVCFQQQPWDLEFFILLSSSQQSVFDYLRTFSQPEHA